MPLALCSSNEVTTDTTNRDDEMTIAIAQQISNHYDATVRPLFTRLAMVKSNVLSVVASLKTSTDREATCARLLDLQEDIDELNIVLTQRIADHDAFADRFPE